MDVDLLVYAVIALAGFAAFYIKGVTGTGTTTIIIGISSFVIAPKMTIVLASLVNIIGGLAMLRIDDVTLNPRYYIPITAMMVVGSVAGAFMLSVIDAGIFKAILGAVFIALSCMFIFTRKRSITGSAASQEKASLKDYIFGWIGGACGGFIGVNAPPLVYHFGKALDKGRLRKLLIIIFIPAAIAQTLTFAVTGLLTQQILYLALAMLPGLVAGIYLGNKTHGTISEVWFRRVLGVLLLFTSAKLLIG